MTYFGLRDFGWDPERGYYKRDQPLNSGLHTKRSDDPSYNPQRRDAQRGGFAGTGQQGVRRRPRVQLQGGGIDRRGGSIPSTPRPGEQPVGGAGMHTTSGGGLNFDPGVDTANMPDNSGTFPTQSPEVSALLANLLAELLAGGLAFNAPLGNFGSGQGLMGGANATTPGFRGGKLPGAP